MTEPTQIDTAAKVIQRLEKLRDRSAISAFTGPTDLAELFREMAEVRSAFETGQAVEEALVRFAHWACWHGSDRALAVAVEVAKSPGLLSFHVDE